ncbi:MAG: amino acid ABC transporter permease [Candidatus Thorarchaeota archaeon]
MMHEVKKPKITLGRIGWSLIAFIIFMCIWGYIVTITEVKFTNIGPIPWIAIITNKYKSYLDLSMDILNNITPLFGIAPIFTGVTATTFRSISIASILTLVISLFSFIMGFIIAIILAVILVLPRNPFGIKSLAQIYVDFFRSTPLLVQILIVYFGVPLLINGTPLQFLLRTGYEVNAAIIGLGLNTGAYQAEILRSGILAIPIGQTEAARGLGLSSTQTMQYVILPQALRLIIPPLTNEGINVILNSSLASVISTREITNTANFIIIATFQPFLVYGIAAIFYFVMAYTLAKLTKRFEEKYRIPGLGVAHD